MSKAITAKQQLALMRSVYARSPSPSSRANLTHLLIMDEAFEEVVQLLSGENDLKFHEALMLADAHLAAESTAANEHAVAVANKAYDLAANDFQRADALAKRGKAEKRLGNIETARQTLLLALQYDPENKDACKRIAAIELEADNPQQVLALADDLLEKGTGHARLFAARALAHARAGEVDAARAAVGIEDLLCQTELAPPPGWANIEDFNEALAEELLAHPAIRYERYGSASELSWRIESPSRPTTPLFNALIGQIIATIGEYCEALSGIQHPWVEARPAEAWLRSWCVITESEGFENWHVHQFGWLSGVYYVRIPDSISQGTTEAGCIAFGLPSDLAGEEGSEKFGEQLVRPNGGTFLAFPSHVYHRTFPHGSGEKRICVAFDVRPNAPEEDD